MSINFGSIYTNFGSDCLNKNPFEGLELLDLQIGAKSDPPESDEENEEEEQDMIVPEGREYKYNEDLAMISSVHPHYLLGRTSSKKFEEPLEDKHQRDAKTEKSVKQSVEFLKNKKVDVKNDLYVLGKAIVLAKDLFLQAATEHHAVAEKRNRHKLVLCFTGHWVEKGDIQGEHAYPSSKIWDRLHQVTLQRLPKELKTKNWELNRIAWHVHLFDARNLIGFCSGCNNKKGKKNLITWLKSNPYYGQEFVSSISPLTNHVIPRTRNGDGLGDAMISYFFTKWTSLTLLADAPLLDNQAIVFNELKTISQLSQKALDQLLVDEENASMAEELRELCIMLVKKLKKKD